MSKILDSNPSMFPVCAAQALPALLSVPHLTGLALGHSPSLSLTAGGKGDSF